MVPRAAMLTAIPIWRNVVLTPEAIPARSGSTTPIAVAASGVFFFQAEAGIRVLTVTGVQTCALPIFGGVGDPGRARLVGDPAGPADAGHDRGQVGPAGVDDRHGVWCGRDRGRLRPAAEEGHRKDQGEARADGGRQAGPPGGS